MTHDTILVSEAEPGKVTHRFCSEEEGKRTLDEALKNDSGGALFTFTDDLGAEIRYEITPNVRTRVENAKAQLRDDIYLRDILNNHDVPKDEVTRRAVYAAIKEIRGH